MPGQVVVVCGNANPGILSSLVERPAHFRWPTVDRHGIWAPEWPGSMGLQPVPNPRHSSEVHHCESKDLHLNSPHQLQLPRLLAVWP